MESHYPLFTDKFLELEWVIVVKRTDEKYGFD